MNNKKVDTKTRNKPGIQKKDGSSCSLPDNIFDNCNSVSISQYELQRLNCVSYQTTKIFSV